MDKILEFQGAYRFLSNFYESEMKYDGVSYRTLEHAFQAAKTLQFPERLHIWLCQTPGEAKRIGKVVELRPDWELVKLFIMKELLHQKFRYPTLKRWLMSTGDAELIEGNNWGDTFWGVCNGVGENHLGKLIMEVRTEIKRNDAIYSVL